MSESEIDLMNFPKYEFVITSVVQSTVQRKKKTKPKKNGFFMYMQQRKPDILAAGHAIRGGWKDLAELVSDDWQALSEAEKAVYHERAKAANNAFKFEKAQKAEVSDMEKLPDEKSTMELARAVVSKMFENNGEEGWRDHSVVICAVNTYFEPVYYGNTYVPAEVGLTAMNLKDGVIDNFCRIIDIDVKSKEGRNYREEISRTVKHLGIPEPGTVPEFSDYDCLVQTLENFIKKYQGNLDLNKNELAVFAFDSDFVMVRQCLDWLFAKTGKTLSVKILSLDQYAFLAASARARSGALLENPDLKDDSWLNYNALVNSTSPYRSVGTPLNSDFAYPDNLPTVQFGVFPTENSVDEVIKERGNYKFHEELSCVYHIKSGMQPQNCALTAANSYAYSLLEILTVSNHVPIITGGHFPEVDKPNIEKTKRCRWLKQWGITEYEEKLENYEKAQEDNQSSILQGRTCSKKPKQLEISSEPPLFYRQTLENIPEEDGEDVHPYQGSVPKIFSSRI